MERVSTPPASVQACERCQAYVATLGVRDGSHWRLLCEACVIETGARAQAVPLQTDSPGDDVPLERQFVVDWCSQLRVNELRIYLWLAAANRPEPSAVVLKTLIHDCGLDRRGAQRGLARLVELGLVVEVRAGKQDRYYLIVRLASGCSPGALSSFRRPEGRIPHQKAIPSDLGGGLFVHPTPNPESQGGGLFVPPLGPLDPLGEALGEGGYCITELPTRRPSDLLVGSSSKSQAGGGGQNVHAEPPPSRAVGGPAGQGPTHPTPPTSALVRSSPDGSRSTLTNEGRSSPDGSRSPSTPCDAEVTVNAAWPDYRGRVLREIRTRLHKVASDAGTPATNEEIHRFLILGSRQEWIHKQARNGSIGSPLHFWCEPARFVGWLRRQSTKHADQRELARQTRLRIAREALALAEGRPLRTCAKAANRRKGK